MTFKGTPKKKSNYPKILSTFEKKRKKDWLKAKQGKKENRSFKDVNSRMVQMFSGKRGK
ncbi:hypothetical protein ACFLZ1_03115 [Patescibacteria group bacterium]